MTSSTPFGRRGLQPPAAWPSAADPVRDESREQRPARSEPPAPEAKAEATPKGRGGEPFDPIWLLFSFNGRIRRSHYWIASIAMQVIVLACLGVIVAQAGLDGLKAAEMSGLLLPFSLPMTWIGFALQVKRWHDRDRSWLWVFIALIPIVGPIWALIECGFLDGTPGPNRFGPSPKGVGGGGAAMDLSAYGIV